MVVYKRRTHKFQVKMSDNENFYDTSLPNATQTHDVFSLEEISAAVNLPDKIEIETTGLLNNSKDPDEKDTSDSSSTNLSSLSFHSEKASNSVSSSGDKAECTSDKSSQHSAPAHRILFKFEKHSNPTGEEFQSLLPPEADSDTEDWANFPGEVEEEETDDCDNADQKTAENSSVEPDKPSGQESSAEHILDRVTNPLIGMDEVNSGISNANFNETKDTATEESENKFSVDSVDGPAGRAIHGVGEENYENKQQLENSSQPVDTVDEVFYDEKQIDKENPDELPQPIEDPIIESSDLPEELKETKEESQAQEVHEIKLLGQIEEVTIAKLDSNRKSSVTESLEEFEPESEESESNDAAEQVEQLNAWRNVEFVADGLDEASLEVTDSKTRVKVQNNVEEDSNFGESNEHDVTEPAQCTADVKEANSVAKDSQEKDSQETQEKNDKPDDAEESTQESSAATKAAECEQRGSSPTNRQRHRSTIASDHPEGRDRQLREARQAYEKCSAELRQAWQSYVARLRELRRDDADAAGGLVRQRPARSVEERHWLSPGESDSAAEVRAWLLNKQRVERLSRQRDGEQRCREQRERLNAETVLNERRRAAQAAYCGWLRRKKRQAPSVVPADTAGEEPEDPHSQLFDLLSARAGHPPRSAGSNSVSSKSNQPVHNSVFRRPMSSVAVVARRRDAARASADSPRIVLAGRRIDAPAVTDEAVGESLKSNSKKQRRKQSSSNTQQPQQSRRAPRIYSSKTDEASSESGALHIDQLSTE